MRFIFCISLVIAITLGGGALTVARAADGAAAGGDAASQPGWHLAYDKKAQTCSVGSYVGNGIFVSIGSERGRMSLSVDDINNDLDVKQSYETTLKMDKGYAKTLPVRPYWINSFAIRLSDDPAMLTAFKASHGFEIGIGGRTYAFQVQDMDRVMADIEGCQASAAQQAQAATPAAPLVAAGAVAAGAAVAVGQGSSTAASAVTPAAPALAAASEASAPSAPLRIVPLAGVKASASAAPKTMEQIAEEAAGAATDNVMATQAAGTAAAPSGATTAELNASQAAKAKAAADATQPAAAAAKGRKGAPVPPPSLAAIDAQKQAIVDAQAAKNAPKGDLKEQDVAALPVPANPRILADNVTPTSAGPGCVSEDRYANLVRKVGLLEVEKEKLRKLSLAAEQGPLQSVMQCAAETNQIKELKSEIAMLRAENDKMRTAAQEAQAASAVDPTDNLSAALNELDEATKNDKK